MNRDDIIRMAREVHDGVVFMPEDLERFAEIVAVVAKAEEREACANLVQDLCDRRVPASEYAAAIRAIGDK